MEANRGTVRATVVDMIAERSAWGFDLDKVACHVDLFHGPCSCTHATWRARLRRPPCRTLRS